MRIIILAAAGAAALVGGCSTMGGRDYSSYSAYDYNRPDPRYNGYYADRYYRSDRSYAERRLGTSDRVYRGRNGRYYCRRDDGTTGLIVGGLAGGTLGAAIAPGGSELLGALIGGAVGAAAGREVDRNDSTPNVTCR